MLLWSVFRVFLDLNLGSKLLSDYYDIKPPENTSSHQEIIFFMTADRAKEALVFSAHTIVWVV